MDNNSANFSILENYAPQLMRLGMQAEMYFREDPNTTIIKLRQFAEIMAQLTAAKLRVYIEDDDRQISVLNRLRDDAGITKGVLDLFHQLRISGNKAVHALKDDHGLALTNLKIAHRLAMWYHRSFGNDKNFTAFAFTPPSDPVDATSALHDEIAALRAKLDQTLTAAQKSKRQAQQEAELRLSAEDERAKLEALNKEAEDYTAQLKEQLAQTQADAEAQEKATMATLVSNANTAAQGLDLDEADTRRIIDVQLRNAGWEADSDSITYKDGVRPQKGKNLAISEWPTSSGPADYVLFVGLKAVGIVEAKRKRKDVYGAVDQAKRYSRDYVIRSDETIPEGGPWSDSDKHDHHIPFVFATNGRPYLKQLETKSGIWFCDLRRPSNLRRALEGWYSPRGLLEMLDQDVDAAHEQLKTEGFDYGITLRDYQINAIKETETGVEKGKREMLLAMATGTGKTATCIALVYRLLKSNRFRRILFLVDRSALGNQTHDAFNNILMERLQKFSSIYDVKGLDDKTIDDSTRIHIATVQSMVKRLLFAEDDSTIPTVDQYDAIVVDECHRGYLLDREMSDTELSFRDQGDYISKYRRVLEHFDAVKIGLTATPALHTTEIFGEPIYTYSYREAVIDGWLIDHEPPIRIKTALSEAGIKWKAGEAIETLNTKTGEINLAQTPDDVEFEVQQFNRKVITPEFNRVVCETLVGVSGDVSDPIDPFDDKKTLIFCVNDNHADIVVKAMKDAFVKAGMQVDDDTVAKITGASDKPQQLIRRYRNESLPKVAVTVDLLTTGIDVPSICNLVFIRRVNSRILYDQMLGRATRRCDEIDKEFFRVFDAVALYDNLEDFTSMKPISANPKFSFAQLVTDLINVEDHDARNSIKDQIVAKLQRSKKRYSEGTSTSIEGTAGMSPGELADTLKNKTADECADWFKTRPTLPGFLDFTGDGTPPVVAISDHEDEFIEIEIGYGDATKPEDFLDGFTKFIKDNENRIAALSIITQRPRELTRQHLKEIRMELEKNHFREADLRAAWRDAKNEDIAASIIGYIRQAALGDPLRPYTERVDHAVREIIQKGTWTGIQKKWLERIAKQLQNEKNDPVIDAETLNQGSFANQGGFKQINKVFGGRLDVILSDINEAVWREVG
ncbi:type I restriction-modification system endonuclease [Terasakiella pusilla]|uniref:type I restriction-modification system endonuclease n=1 Tax=Terasakiella pusilla TaxID=64973 RepID=UPI003AA981B8